MPTAATTASSTTSLTALGSTVPGKIVLSLAATAVVAAAAHVALPLPFTPVPLTLQPLAVLGVGLAFGPVLGLFTMLAYLLEGVCGLPVFSPTGPGGILQLLGPTGGYLMAYPFVAAVAGGLTRIASHRLALFPAALLGCTAAIVMLFLCGAEWIMRLTGLSLQAAWVAAVLPFLPGEAVKIFVAAGIYSTLHRARRIQ